MFHIVDLKGHPRKEKAVVPDIWLSIQNTLCALPPSASDKELEGMVQKRVDPEPGWKIFGIRSLQTFESYVEAKGELERSREAPQSDTGPRRKRKKPSYLTEYSSQDSENEAASPTTIFKTEFLDLEDLSENEWFPSPELSLIPIGKDKRKSSGRPIIIQHSPNRPSSPKQTSCKFSCHNTILRLLHNIQKQLEENNQLVKQLLRKNAICPTTQESKKFPFNLPVTDLKSLQEIDDYLQDDVNFEQGVKFVSLLGGKDEKEATRRILSRLIDHKLALQLSWAGSEAKQPFNNFTNIQQLIAVCVRKNPFFEECTQDVIEETIKRWLRYAADREGGRMRRKTAMPNEQI